jgi:putative endonuclease
MYVYILYSASSDKYYIGQSENVEERLKVHNSNKKTYTSPYRPWILKLVIKKATRSDAIVLEKKLKNLSRERLISFVNKHS